MNILRYTSPDENFEYGYPYSNALLQSRLIIMTHKGVHRQMKCDVMNAIKLFLTVYCSILTLSH